MFEYFGIPDALGVFLLIAIPAIAIYFARQKRNASEDRLREIAGDFQVDGVNRVTKKDESRVIQANSADNAKAKAELGDMVVTRVTRK